MKTAEGLVWIGVLIVKRQVWPATDPLWPCRSCRASWSLDEGMKHRAAMGSGDMSLDIPMWLQKPNIWIWMLGYMLNSQKKKKHPEVYISWGKCLSISSKNTFPQIVSEMLAGSLRSRSCFERTKWERDPLFAAVRKRIKSVSFSKDCEHTWC